MTGLLLVLAALFTVNVAGAGVVIFFRLRNNLRAKRFGRIEARWEPVIVRHIGGEDEVAAIPEKDVRHVLEIAGRLARRLRGPALERVQDFSTPHVHWLLPNLSARSPEKRAAAVDLLGVLALDSQGARVVAALEDPVPRVSLVAAQALSRPNYSQHTDAVLEHLHRYAHRSPALTSSMLARVGPGALKSLRRYLEDETRPARARGTVADSLRLLRDPESAEIAANQLGSDEPELVVACLRLIDAVGSPIQADRVRALLEHTAFFVRSEAITVLSHIGEPSDVSSIARMLHEGSPWVAIRSARALMEMGEHRMLEDLSEGDDLAAVSAREILAQQVV